MPSSATSPSTNPTLSTKGKFQVDDKGQIQVTLKGVTDGGGSPATTSTTWKDSSTLDGSQYMAVIRGTFTASSTAFESAVPVDLKNGNGTGKLTLGGMVSLIPAGAGRSVEVNGVEVWGPLGAAKVAPCTGLLGVGFTVVPSDPACRGGTKIGVAGINIP